jgi:hypothetical protein
LLLVKRTETSRMLFQGTKQHHFKHLEDMSSVVWGANVMTLTRSGVRTAMTASRMWSEQLAITSTASHALNSFDSCSTLR